MHTRNITGKMIAFLATDGVEQIELTQPWETVRDAGAKPCLVSLEAGYVQGMHHDEKGDQFEVDMLVEDAYACDFDALILPGGLMNPDALRTNPQAVKFVKQFFDSEKPVAAICHGPWVLIEAGVLPDRTLTSWPSLETDIRNAGGTWVDKKVVVDNQLITSRNPDDLDAFCNKILEAFFDAEQERKAA